MDLEYFDRIVRNFDGSIDRFQRAVEQLDGLVFRMEKLSERSESAAPDEALLKGLTEAGGRRVMCGSDIHYEDEYAWLGPNGEKISTCASRGCVPADMTDPDVQAWVARQRKDSHAGA